MPKTIFVRHGRLHYFVREVLKRLRLPDTHDSRVGDALVAAERAGDGGGGVSTSTACGMAGYYARLALAEQMIGIAVSNAAPAMVPTYGTRAMLGSNPIAIAIPSAEDDAPFVLDMSTTVTSRAELEA